MITLPFIFFFDSDESQPVGRFDEQLAYQFETWIRISCEPRIRQKRNGGTVQEKRQFGIANFHHAGKMSYEVVAYFLRASFSNGTDWYSVIVRFLDRTYQQISIEVHQKRDEQPVSVYDCHYSPVVEQKLVFRSEEIRQEYRQLPTLFTRE